MRETCDRESTGPDEIARTLEASLHEWVDGGDPVRLMAKLDVLVGLLGIRSK